MRDLTGLNEAQRRAVVSTEGRVLILAGAGSGKTKVLTTRIAYLTDRGILPEAIVGLTFTNKAAEEMRERLTLMVGAAVAKRVLLMTFHSFCMWMLRREISRLGYTGSFTILDEHDVGRLVRTIARDILEHEGALPSLESASHALGLAMNRGVAPEAIEGTGSEWHDGFVQEIAKRLRIAMRAHNALDFDHLLVMALELLEEHPDILARYRERFRYIMIDEYQDTSPVQARLAFALSGDKGNICVVGDDDQSIYGWRGADVANILSFPCDERITLEQNYRSTNSILKAANAIIRGNSRRHDKSLWSTKGDGYPVELFCAPSDVEEAEGVAARIVKKREELGLHWGDFAILFRSSVQARAIETALLKAPVRTPEGMRRGVPYKLHGGREFCEHKEIRDLVAYLRVMANPHDESALVRILNYPRRGIGEALLDELTQESRNAKVPIWDQLCAMQDAGTKASKGVHEFIALIEEGRELASSLDAAALASWCIGKARLDKAIENEVKSDAMRRFKRENQERFIELLAECESGELAEVVGRFSLHGEDRVMRGREQSDDVVHVMTIHSSKGLEFPIVFLVGVEEGILPHERALAENGAEEERRLMYVAMTRAKQELVVSMAMQRMSRGKQVSGRPSRFVRELPKELINVSKWDEMNR